MVTIGVIKNSSFGGGSGSNSPIPFGELRLIARGSQNGIANTGPLKPGDFVEGMKDARFKWKSARYNGGDITNRANYTPLVEIDLENDTEVIIPPVVVEPGVIVLPTTDFYFESFWEAADTVHEPYINSWVDYIDGSGNLHHFILGGIENGCQLIVASSILDTNGCATCVLPVDPPPPVDPPVDPPPPVEPPAPLPTSNFYFEGRWLSDDTIHKPELNSWVDYVDAEGNIDRYIIGGIEGGCQLIVASSILGRSGCHSCVPEVPLFYQMAMSNSTPISNCAGAGVSTYPIQIFVQRSPVLLNDTIYTNQGLTNPFPGDGTWYSLSNNFSMRVNGLGVVTQIDNSCAPLQ